MVFVAVLSSRSCIIFISLDNLGVYLIPRALLWPLTYISPVSFCTSKNNKTAILMLRTKLNPRVHKSDNIKCTFKRIFLIQFFKHNTLLYVISGTLTN